VPENSKRTVRGAELQPGMTVELYGSQTLFDFASKPLKTYATGDRLVVKQVTRMATGRRDRQPYEILFDKDGSEISLELDSGATEFQVVE
jgi:hypothetical protein